MVSLKFNINKMECDNEQTKFFQISLQTFEERLSMLFLFEKNKKYGTPNLTTKIAHSRIRITHHRHFLKIANKQKIYDVCK